MRTAASVGYSRRSEVGRDGLQGVFRCTMDVHILQRGTHQCQMLRVEKHIYGESREQKACSSDLVTTQRTLQVALIAC